MKIILIQSVKNIGVVGDIIEVSNGYARNYLIPNNQAIIYSKSNYQLFRDKKENYQLQFNNLTNNLNILNSTLDSKYISIKSNASDDGRLYGSVKKSDIANEINLLLTDELKKTFHLTKKNIILKNSIKEIGIYEIMIDFQGDVNPIIKLAIGKTGEEIKSLIKKDKESSPTSPEITEENIVLDSQNKDS